uniref:IU_nuc_hydro domain-containing protein n=1 Tax=Rhabditophanes sp. KR3021 TaxID=114890 RepID=A0AC35U8H0_9BILA
MKVIIDTDAVVDDCRAISLAVQAPEAEVLAITTVTGCIHVDKAVANVSRTLRANGNQAQIPIYKGASETLIVGEFLPNDETTFFGHDGIGDKPHVFPPSLESDKDNYVKGVPAALALTQLVRKFPGEITIIALGPLTNLALAIKLDPDFKKNVKKIVAMGGNVYGIGNIDPDQTGEYNFASDPESAHIVLHDMACPVTVVPWECFYFESIKGSHDVDFHAHLNVGTPLSDYFAALTSLGREMLGQMKRQYAFCDEIAVASALYPDKIITEAKNLRGIVELHGRHTRGQIAVDWYSNLWSEVPGEAVDSRHIGKNRYIQFVMKYNTTELVKIFEEMVRKE